MANESTGTGVAELDQALDGLYWGDNVVWVWEGTEPHQQLFYDAIAQRRDDFGRTGYVVVFSDPAEVTARWPWIEILDALGGHGDHQPAPAARRDTPVLHQSAPPAAAVRLAGAAGRPLGHADRQRLLRALLPDAARPRRDRLLVGTGGEPIPAMHREIEQITQCIIVVGEGRLRISKAEGRPPGAQGQLFRYSVKDGRAATAAGPGSRARRCGVARLPPAPGTEPERSGPPRRGLPEGYLPSGAGRTRALLRDADGPVPGASTSPSTSCSAARSPRTTGSAGATASAPRPRARSCRCSTTPRPACAPTSSPCPDRLPGPGPLRPQGRRTSRGGQRPHPGTAVIGPSRPPPRRNAPRLPPRHRRLAQRGRGRRAVPGGS